MSQSILYVCGSCGSAAVDYSDLTDAADCRVCKWSGKKSELLAIPSMARLEENFNEMRQDVRKAFAPATLGIVSFLAKWHFVEFHEDTPVKEKMFASMRYVNVAINAAVKALFEERDKIEKERLSGATGA